jgi:lysophospholipid acyltransferase (LPLAT)-like uncharacterized protein
VLERLGFSTVRGSSRLRGAAALRELLRRLGGRGEPLAVVVDGPLGPAGRAKTGVVYCARISKRPVRAVGTAASWRLVFPGTWSGIYLPLPFSRVVVAVDRGLEVPESASWVEMDELSELLSDRFVILHDAAKAAVRDRKGRSAAVPLPEFERKGGRHG